MSGNLGRKRLPQLRSVKSWRRLSASQVNLSMMKMNLKHKMKTEVSIVDRIDELGAVKTEKPYQQLSHRESVGEHHMKEYNYEHSQGNNLNTIRN